MKTLPSNAECPIESKRAVSNSNRNNYVFVFMFILILRLSCIVAAVAAVYRIDQSSTLLHNFVDESESFASVIRWRRKLLGLRLHWVMTSSVVFVVRRLSSLDLLYT